MKTKYHIEIYEPDDSSCVLASFQSDTPFGAMNIGDAINGSTLNLNGARQYLRITDIEHILWEITGSHISHKICVYTELSEQA